MSWRQIKRGQAMRKFVTAVAMAAGLAAAFPALAQHDSPNPDRLPSGGGDFNAITITPVSPVQPQPIAQIETAPLPDIGPDRMMERYLDGVFAGQIAAGRIPGAAVVVIRNGEVVVKKGYGFADLDKKNPVDPDTTQFRVASISKLFTALLAMQEVEAGRLALDSDVNAALKSIKLAPVGPKPITLRSLLNHTSGFDDKYLGVGAALGAPREELAAHLAAHTPRLVLPVGKVFNYSNYGYALAGHLAAQSAGQDFRALMAERFFAPLQMTRSSFGVPEPVPVTMAQPYSRTPQGLVPARLDQTVIYPAGDLVTTADDLSRFMVALVNDSGGLVQPDTFKSMTKPSIVPGKTADAWGLGFALGESNGVDWFGHGGAWPGFAAELRVNAETKSGFLILLNTDNSFDVVQPIVNAVTDALWPDTREMARPATADALIAASDLEGTFMPIRRARYDFTKLGAGLASLRLAPDGQGRLTGTFGGLPQRLVFEPESDGVWRERTFRWRLSVFDGADGAAREGIVLGPFAFERASFADDLGRQIPFLGAAAAVLAVLLAAWGSGAFSRKMFGEPMAVVPLGSRILGTCSAALGLAFLAGFAGAMAGLKDQDVLTGSLGALPMLLALPVVIAPATLGMAFVTVRGFGPGLRARMAQGAFGLLTLSLVFLLWFIWTWNLHIFAR
jgi:CubicO group peptidase (beta-lactamase class C family)